MKKAKIYQLGVKHWTDQGVALAEAKQIVADQAGKSWGTIARALRKVKQKKVSKKQVVGIIADTHVPYEHPDYLQFCIETFKKHKVNKVVHIGDLIDHHAMSFHDSEPGLKGAHGERMDAIERLQPWYDAFPKLTYIRGNHCRIPARQMTKMGLDPDVYMRPLGDVYGFPKGWESLDSTVIDNVVYHHGETATGQNGFRMDAKNRMMNSVSGHNHSNLGVSYTACDHRMVWGMAVGCGVDVGSLAFAYGKNFKQKPALGCGIVADNGKTPMVFAMDLGEKW